MNAQVNDKWTNEQMTNRGSDCRGDPRGRPNGAGEPGSDAWTVYPAIDLRQGRVVRLMQGDPDQETRYADDPSAVAQRWQEAGAPYFSIEGRHSDGAPWLHVVNLDGALDEGGVRNRAALVRILATGMRVQFGGGLRDLEAIRGALALGVQRAVIGTAAVEEPALVEAALDAFGAERIAVGIDARDGIVRTHGWTQAAGLPAVDLARRWADRGVRWFIFTDVARDGMGSGLNLESTVHLARETSARVIASGGVASLEDVRRAYRAGLSGVIIGRALYEGQVKLEDALRVAEEPRPTRSG